METSAKKSVKQSEMERAKVASVKREATGRWSEAQRDESLNRGGTRAITPNICPIFLNLKKKYSLQIWMNLQA
jgi:hypothetical protein